MPGLVLLTGATGNIGFQILLQALERGYQVRCAVRSDAKAVVIRQHRLIKKHNLSPETLSFMIVSDITTDNAYDEAIKSCQYAIHVATVVPLSVPGADPAKGKELFVDPAVKSTLSILTAAQKERAIRRVVITSSAVAVIPWRTWVGLDPPTGRVYTSNDRNPMEVDAEFETLQQGYVAAKTASLRQTDAWMKHEKPSFALVNIHPAFVIGKNELAESEEDVLRGTNMVAFSSLIGTKKTDIRAGSCCHVREVAETHVVALDKPDGLEPGSIRGFALGLPVKW